jgi:hypothetical protein
LAQEDVDKVKAKFHSWTVDGILPNENRLLEGPRPDTAPEQDQASTAPRPSGPEWYLESSGEESALEQ